MLNSTVTKECSNNQSTTIQLEPLVINSSTLSDLIEDQPITSCCFITSIRSDRKKNFISFSTSCTYNLFFFIYYYNC